MVNQSQLDLLVAYRIVADVLMSDDPAATGRGVSELLAREARARNVEATEKEVRARGLPGLVYGRSAALPRPFGNVGQNWRRALG